MSSAFVGAVPLIPLFKIGEGAMERVDELKRHIPERKTSDDEKGQMESRGEIELQNVKFSYNNQRILQGVSTRGNHRYCREKWSRKVSYYQAFAWTLSSGGRKNSMEWK